MELVTNRLRIRSFDMDDVDDYYAIVGDATVMAHLGGAMSQSQAAAYVRRVMQTERNFGFARYAVELQETGHLVGMCGYAPIDGYVDLGYRFALASWGYGLATEAAQVVIRYGFEELGFSEITATALAANQGSFRVMEKLGFVFRCAELTRKGLDSRRYVLPRGRWISSNA